jgi:hypothetical protein
MDCSGLVDHSSHASGRLRIVIEVIANRRKPFDKYISNGVEALSGCQQIDIAK